MDNKIFKEQISEDIQILKEKLSWDSNIKKDEYTFNYWILSNIYNLDEEECNNNITEYNDKGIDCFVHYEDDKELYIIQNKYYKDETNLNSKELSDFLTRPLSKLNEGNYKRSSELQKIYNIAKNDDSYKIFLHFYLSNDNSNKDLDSIISGYQSENNIFFDFFFLSDIKEKYFGKSFKENSYLKTILKVKNKGTYLAIRPQEYSLPNMSEAYYVMAKINDIYDLWEDAENNDYPLFEENIREYLGGKSGINKGIISTLKNPKERGNFFYYNNGITIICDSAKADSKKVDIENPQIVNGCQTVNSIAEALKNIKDKSEFEDVYVMAKILVLEKKNNSFYRDIVKYTNSQNSINYKVFGATLKPFFTIQKKIKDFGFLVPVKQSDKFKYKEEYKDKVKLGKLLEKARKNISEDFYEIKNLTNIQISLENMIQIIGAYIKDANFAYTKKSFLLKPSSTEYYQNFSTKIGELLTMESIVKLIILYKKAENDKRNSEDKKSPAPYYFLNFIGFYLETLQISKQLFLKLITKEELVVVYNNFKILSSKYSKEYKKTYNMEYNQMIKQKVDTVIMKNVLDKHFESLKEYNESGYNELNKIFNRIKKKA